MRVVSDLDRFRVGSPLAKLLAGRARPHKAFDLDIVRAEGRTTIRLAVRALTADDAARAHAEAIKWLVGTGGWQREDLIGDAGDAVLNLEVMVQTLARALVDPEKPDTLFAADASEVRAHFEVDEIRACWDEYLSWSQERSPFRSLKTLDEVREVADSGKRASLHDQLAALRFRHAASHHHFTGRPACDMDDGELLGYIAAERLARTLARSLDPDDDR